MLGRVYKDRWEAAMKSGDAFLARGLLDRAIDAYLRGFEADWRDAYPGINAVTLMELREPPDPRRVEINPIVRYSVGRHIATGKPNYCDHATLSEPLALTMWRGPCLGALAHIVRKPSAGVLHHVMVRDVAVLASSHIPACMPERVYSRRKGPVS